MGSLLKLGGEFKRGFKCLYLVIWYIFIGLKVLKNHKNVERRKDPITITIYLSVSNL